MGSSNKDRVTDVSDSGRKKLILCWLPCHMPGSLLAVLGLVGPASTYYTKSNESGRLDLRLLSQCGSARNFSRQIRAGLKHIVHVAQTLSKQAVDQPFTLTITLVTCPSCLSSRLHSFLPCQSFSTVCCQLQVTLLSPSVFGPMHNVSNFFFPLQSQPYQCELLHPRLAHSLPAIHVTPRPLCILSS